MESKYEKKKEGASIIFRASQQKAEKKLSENSAAYKESKEVWLLRESSVPGLLTISYYDKGKHLYRHRRIGFVNGKWENASSIKAKAEEFVKKAEAAFKNGLPENSEEELYKYLQAEEFKREKQLIPAPDEASQQYAYVELESSSTPYTKF
ncbi:MULTISPECIES: hypothetical protein [unclassified Legionella]|uniref:hypothetical protein n=1 Tax=unclassified Legionella TaxID=2622702 RepID=UPI001054AA8E|nr:MULTISPECIES: hypothetical protein [unclassified Legionella]MDI9817806.1 hypothetical protein [Legionella sp. PL877]